MDFIHFDLGNISQGNIVEITLDGNAANVRLLDDLNFSRYRKGEKHTYFGGLAKKSPIKLQVPNSGYWHVAVDMQGMRGKTQAAVRLLPN